jgi:hypothetical protein
VFDKIETHFRLQTERIKTTKPDIFDIRLCFTGFIPVVFIYQPEPFFAEPLAI